LFVPSANCSLLGEKLCHESEQAVSWPRVCFSFPQKSIAFFAMPSYLPMTLLMIRFLADLG
jgi:hypothetical protein